MSIFTIGPTIRESPSLPREAVGTIPKTGPETEKVKEKEMQMLISEDLRPYIYKIELNKKNREMVDVWLDLDAPGTFSVRLTVIPESRFCEIGDKSGLQSVKNRNHPCTLTANIRPQKGANHEGF